MGGGDGLRVGTRVIVRHSVRLVASCLMWESRLLLIGETGFLDVRSCVQYAVWKSLRTMSPQCCDGFPTLRDAAKWRVVPNLSLNKTVYEVEVGCLRMCPRYLRRAAVR